MFGLMWNYLFSSLCKHHSESSHFVFFILSLVPRTNESQALSLFQPFRQFYSLYFFIFFLNLIMGLAMAALQSGFKIKDRKVDHEVSLDC